MFKVSTSWLQEWVGCPVDAAHLEDLVEKLNGVGLEVDGACPVAPPFSGVVVGEILQIDPHPKADKLHICTVRIHSGEGSEKTPSSPEALQIVCGATNIFVGMKAPLAMLGAKLPGITIREATLRGVTSYGMLCSAAELGLSDESLDIVALPKDARVGEDVRQVLSLDDIILPIELTANRGDCASVRGIAREISSIYRCALYVPPFPPVAPVIADRLPVDVQAPEACPCYLGRVIRGLNPHAQTPEWMAERLRRGGFHPIHPIVDVTNYVLLELGQPLHAFDCAQVSEIQVRFAHAGESLSLLDGVLRSLTPETLVIADGTQPLAMAGIMGGLSSGISVETTDIFLESAFFNPTSIQGKAKHYGLQTEASYRFEHGVDFELALPGLERATALLLSIAGGLPGPVIEVKSSVHMPRKPVIELDLSSIPKLLGVDFPESEVESILTALGIEIDRKDTPHWIVTIPSSRFDLRIEADVIAEVARIHGYNELPLEPAIGNLQTVPIDLGTTQIRAARQLLAARGYREVITYSFIDPLDQQRLDPGSPAIPLQNPMGEGFSVMRTNLWPSLLKTLQYNLDHQQERVQIFEHGLRYRQSENGILQEEVISGLIYGPVYPVQWGIPVRSSDFFDIKADVIALLGLTHRVQDILWKGGPLHPALHPGIQAALFLDEELVGRVGALHPSVLQAQGLRESVFVFEILVRVLERVRLPVYRPISKYPEIHRDLAFVVDTTLSGEKIEAAVRQLAGSRLAECILFDVFQGAKLGAQKKSVALRLVFQDVEKTLEDLEIQAMIRTIVSGMKESLGADVRDG